MSEQIDTEDRRVAQSCVTTSTTEYEAEQQRLAERVVWRQQEASQQQIDPRRHQIYTQPGWPPSGEGQYRDPGDPCMTPLQERKMPFVDRPIAGQIEVLRREVLQLRAANTHLHNLFNQLQNLRQHEHVNGKVMVPADYSHPPMGVIGSSALGSYDPLA